MFRKFILRRTFFFLFFRVMQNKREQDGGTYWCEANSTAGIAQSRNATLQIASKFTVYTIIFYPKQLKN